MKMTLFLVSLLTIGIVFGDDPEKGCNNPADLVFVLDESTSISESDFKKQLDFVQDTIASFDVGFNRTRVGVLTFATYDRVIFPLGEYTNKAELKAAVKAIKQSKGNTYTHLALKRLREEMFSKQYARPWVRHVAIVITDGQSTSAIQTEKEAQLCHEENIEMYAIGVGEAVNRKELEAIASALVDIFTVDSYAALESLRMELVSKTCGRCDNPADLMFVLDESTSISESDFKKQLDFVQDTIASFDVGFNRTHVGVLTFATYDRVIFPLGEYTDEAELKTAVKAIKQSKGNTYTHLALKRLREEMFSKQYARPWVRHVAIVITDGQSTSAIQTEKEAQLCHEENIEMYAIGVGEAVNRKELEAIASALVDIFTVDSYAALEFLRMELVSKTCGTPTTPTPPKATCAPKPVTPIAGCKMMDLIWSISDQVCATDTKLAINFINSVTQEMTIGPNDVQVGLSPRFCDEGNGIRLKDYDTVNGFRDALDRRLLIGQRTERTIEYIRRQGHASVNGGRWDAVKYTILIVDNESEDWEKTLAEAERAKAENIRLIVIGVGDRVKQDQLRQLASSEEAYFYIQNYHELADLKTLLIQTICEGKLGKKVRLRDYQYFERFYY